MDILDLSTAIIEKYHYTMKDFWELPLFQIFKLLHAFDDRKTQPIGRKQLVDNWRQLNVQFGNV